MQEKGLKDGDDSDMAFDLDSWPAEGRLRPTITFMLKGVGCRLKRATCK